MKELKTLLSGGATEFERELLGALAGERPSPELQLRMQQVIGLGPGALPEPDGSSPGGDISGTHLAVKPAVRRWTGTTWVELVLGVGTGAGLVAGALALRAGEPAPLPRASAPSPEQPAAAVSSEPPTLDVLGAASSRELREEIDLLDRVRGALDQRQAAAASALLAQYAARFPQGRLAREAGVLRARAAQLARRVP